MRTPSRRPAGAYVHGFDGPVTIVTGRVAAFMLTRTDLARIRAEVRGTDPELDAGLLALTEVANRWRTSATSAASGSEFVDSPEVAPPLEAMTSTAAADVLGIGDRAVRLACADGRLPAVQENGRWRIARADVDNYRRRAA